MLAHLLLTPALDHQNQLRHRGRPVKRDQGPRDERQATEAHELLAERAAKARARATRDDDRAAVCHPRLLGEARWFRADTGLGAHVRLPHIL